MHIAVFFLVNLVVAVGIGVMAHLDGHGALGIVWRVGAALILLQAAYVLWIIAVAWIVPYRADEGQARETPVDPQPRRVKLSQPPRNPR